MNEHADTLKEAWELALRVEPISDVDATPLTTRLGTCKASAIMLRTLAKIVEEQDAVLAKQGNEREARIREREKRTAILEGRLDDYLAERSNIIAEMRAACVTCDEAITGILRCRVFIDAVNRTADAFPSQPMPLEWVSLRDARHLVRLAVKLAEPKGDVDEEQLAKVKAEMVKHAVAQIESGDNDFMDADKFKKEPVATMDMPHGTQSSEPPAPAIDRDRYYRLRNLRCARCLMPPELEEYHRLRKSLGLPEEVRTGLPALAIEIEMRVVDTCAGWTWRSKLGERWVAFLANDAYSVERESAIKHGNTWLAALSEQLGLKLMAKWKDGE